MLPNELDKLSTGRTENPSLGNADIHSAGNK
jgi:hypothetical protein